MTPTAVILEARNLGKSYRVNGRPLPILRDISFQLAAGESVAIQGVSGSGKSTLLSLLAGLDRPTAGEIILENERLDLLPEKELARIRREKIGFVFQAFHLVPSLTVLENVLLPAAFRSGAFSEDRGRALLDRVGLADRAGHFPDQLSGGEKQRAALARALVNAPKLIFADEPTGNLDSKNGRAVLDLLEEHTRTAGRALVLVTHDDAVASRADRRLRLIDGALAPAP
ncbi:MAG TPA: ABC transporter ATP-binding protein [Elusimicrobiota bacterium]|nr:ABC transporter ATP-binding protein [Elusimicrobiota bacterium]HMZ26306.1 ABC transporter ATP-binding protein [Elusimicrobiota bacterium]HNA59951.1 ABC transporter ATP-binding protein [Elusimicrobiota bacterium]HNC74319.1 ABC transporter ATP-binding protein [Elusimicrobiota bacterium]HND63283.1 ABC transporter ATP-binding protein [Elusimicrobiota bacterium]